MNFLAHAYLSFQQPEIVVGNMISDFVKGKTQYDYTTGIQSGIALHRFIDAYTDSHSSIKLCKKIFAPHYRLYSGAIVDVVMDHYVALHLASQINLMAFCQHCYHLLQVHHSILPISFQKVLHTMQAQNWLYNYQFEWGIQKSFQGLLRRAKYIAEMDTAFQLFQTHYASLQQQFHLFWPDLCTATKEQYKLLHRS
jgi:acyl carrier protein phosphodiesterase